MKVDLEKIQEDVTITKEMVQTLLTLFNQLSATLPSSDVDVPLTVEQAADFLNLSPQTVYQNIAKIPHRKRHGRLYFFRAELTTYLNQLS